MLDDFKHILKKPILLISLLAIAMIPAIYTSIFLGSMWDPYDSMDQLKIDVVNEDEGAELDGEEINLGRDLVDELKDNDEFEWQFTDMEKAGRELGHGEVYAVVKIPADASEKAANLLKPEAENIDIEIRTNPGYNFLGSVMGSSAGKAIKDEVSLSVTKLYTETLVENLSDVKTNNEDLLDALAEMQTGVDELIEGSEAVESGLMEMDNGVNRSMGELSEGNRQVTDGLYEMNKNLAAMESQVPPQMAGQLDGFSAGLDELIAGNEAVQQGIDQVGPGVSEGAGELAEGSRSMTEGLTELDEGLNEMITEVEEGLAEFDGLELTDDNAGFIADPITVSETEVTEIENYGQTFAPFIVAVSLFLGCIAFSVLYPLNRSQDNYRNAFTMTVSKTMLLITHALISTGILFAVLKFGFELEIAEPGQFYLIMLLWTLAALMVIAVLVALLGNVGKFIAVILLILQLSSSAGTFPIQTAGGLYQTLHPVLPMSYAVTAMREVIFDFEAVLTTHSTFVYLAVIIGVTIGLFSLINILKFRFRKFENITREMSRIEY
ncbi:YhgE/Pip family protein [Salinicoccus halodurans]|uniref:Membrane protein n=1 Tax=Salinicoccus halodurans TaxID=407035 RepID=A0A0F7HK81_9STAP|nr:YhgE/Pip domain-containing protein [Salinicoccus halodurans]AKG73537.1 hypothetical protein AAT16_04495 [Salinicoccus halodurans]SFK52229.1 putative membrane protein [Salinicoccus halodurans]